MLFISPPMVLDSDPLLSSGWGAYLLSHCSWPAPGLSEKQCVSVCVMGACCSAAECYDDTRAVRKQNGLYSCSVAGGRVWTETQQRSEAQYRDEFGLAEIYLCVFNN